MKIAVENSFKKWTHSNKNNCSVKSQLKIVLRNGILFLLCKKSEKFKGDNDK